jgi:hypothetical protein
MFVTILKDHQLPTCFRRALSFSAEIFFLKGYQPVLSKPQPLLAYYEGKLQMPSGHNVYPCEKMEK